MTTAIVRALEQLHDVDQQPESIDSACEPSLNDPVVGQAITHGQVIAISKKLEQVAVNSNQDGSTSTVSFQLDDLLRGSTIYVEPSKPKAEPTSQFKTLMARLRREEEARVYKRMTNPAVASETFSQRFPYSSQANLFPAAQADIGQDDEISYADVNRQMALIINILISIVACSVAIWMAARHWSTPSRLGLSMGGSSMIGVAEVVVYAGYLRRLKEAREKGKKEIEVKEIIKTWVIGSEEKSGSTDSTPIESKASHDDRIRRRKLMPG